MFFGANLDKQSTIINFIANSNISSMDRWKLAYSGQTARLTSAMHKGVPVSPGVAIARAHPDQLKQVGRDNLAQHLHFPIRAFGPQGARCCG